MSYWYLTLNNPHISSIKRHDSTMISMNVSLLQSVVAALILYFLAWIIDCRYFHPLRYIVHSRTFSCIHQSSMDRLLNHDW